MDTAGRLLQGVRPALRIAIIVSVLVASLAFPTPTLAAWSGWSEVPGNGTTRDAQNAVTFGGRLYLFAVGGDDRRIYLKVNNGSTWSAWSQVPGGLTTPSSPSAVVYKQRLWLVARSGNQIMRNKFNGTSWSGWASIQTSDYGTPDVAVYGGRLWLFLQYSSVFYKTFNGSTWSSIATIPGDASTNMKSTAVVYNKRLYVFATDFGGAINRNWYDGKEWSGWAPVVGAGTPDPSDALVYGNRLWLFTRKSNSEIYSNKYNGSSWSGWVEVAGDGLTPSMPAGAAFKKRIWLFVRGTNDHHFVNRFKT
jgi:hypothetical protein